MAAPSSWKAWRWVSVAWARMGTEVGPPPLPSCCMLRDSKNPVPTGRYGRDGDAVW
jgi:hypothetical protein